MGDNFTIDNLHFKLTEIRDILREIRELLSEVPAPKESDGEHIASRPRIRTMSEAAAVLEQRTFKKANPITAEEVRSFMRSGK